MNINFLLNSTKIKSGRDCGIETIRVVSILTIVFFHWFSHRSEEGSPAYTIAYYFFTTVNDFAVPVFMMITGYFMAKSLAKGTAIQKLMKRYISRLLPLYLVWLALYATLPYLGVRSFLNGNFSNILLIWEEFFVEFSEHPIYFFFNNITPHLWFLPSLLVSVIGLLSLIKVKKAHWALPIGVLLYISYLLTYSFAETPIGFPISEYFPHGAWIGFLYVALGYTAAKKNWRLSQAQSLLFVGLVFVGVLLEKWYLSTLLTGILPSHVLMTPIFGLSVLMLGLTFTELGRGTFLPGLAQITLGIYVLHPMLQNKLFQLGLFEHTVIIDFFGPFIIYMITTIAVALLVKFKPMKLLFT